MDLLSAQSYDTPLDAGKFFSGIFPRVSFYSKLLWIILQAGRKAKKNMYDENDWIADSLGTLRALEDAGVKAHFRGMENISKVESPCVFIANHMSTLETFILPCIIQARRDVTFVVKDSLLKYPYFGAVLASRNPIVVGRTNPREDLATVLGEGVERLKNGRSVIIFPQSTRSLGFDARRFNSGGIKLARKAGVPAVPVALRTDAWGMGKLIKDVGPINSTLPLNITFGDPINVAGNGKAEHAQICEFVKSHLEAWGLPSLSAGVERTALETPEVE